MIHDNTGLVLSETGTTNPGLKSSCYECKNSTENVNVLETQNSTFVVSRTTAKLTYHLKLLRAEDIRSFVTSAGARKILSLRSSICWNPNSMCLNGSPLTKFLSNSPPHPHTPTYFLDIRHTPSTAGIAALLQSPDELVRVSVLEPTDTENGVGISDSESDSMNVAGHIEDVAKLTGRVTEAGFGTWT
ncbi:hypothetical protein EDD17DRAFT_1611824 [Pisolithus thermaeus]|nr:hypothetical protein EDD17DRAFT_1611824 [Pisolithus thermaeus]